MTLSPAEEDRARRLHAESYVFAAHTDFIAGVSEGRTRGERGVAAKRQLPLLRAGGVKAVCEHVAGDTPYFATFAFRNIRPLAATKFALQALDYWHAELEESDGWRLVLEAADFRRAERESRVAVVFGFEGAMPIDDDLGLLRMFHRLGIRSIGLTWNGRNLLGDGVSVGAGGGLTAYGRAAIAEMNRLGIVIDVSHMSDDGIRDAAEASTAPIIASHSNARSLCDHPRNLPDELALAIGRRGGVVGLHMMSRFLRADGVATLDDFLDHVDHLVKLVGPAHVGLGPDCMEQWPADAYRDLWVGTEASKLEFTYPPEFDSLAKCPNVTRGLVARGYDDAAIRGIMGDNFLRVFETVLF
ncbi:MAG: membrane dipeptidase [Candidatus Rokubacteria bacterium]|nr:membrane dipeptidase [Candidatus Rokubacteria bacterium]